MLVYLMTESAGATTTVVANGKDGARRHGIKQSAWPQLDRMCNCRVGSGVGNNRRTAWIVNTECNRSSGAQNEANDIMPGEIKR